MYGEAEVGHITACIVDGRFCIRHSSPRLTLFEDRGIECIGELDVGWSDSMVSIVARGVRLHVQ